jgi:hypothetical protein
MDNVGEDKGWDVRMIEPWVDMALNVCAAEVYSKSRVAAGRGVAGSRGLHARTSMRASPKKMVFLTFELRIRDSEHQAMNQTLPIAIQFPARRKPALLFLVGEVFSTTKYTTVTKE